MPCGSQTGRAPCPTTTGQFVSSVLFVSVLFKVNLSIYVNLCIKCVNKTFLPEQSNQICCRIQYSSLLDGCKYRPTFSHR